jgi:serine/threonine protein kinase
MTEPAYPDALPALSRLHWYVLERVLGQGGFGITYLAKDTNLDQRVAIKEYLPIDVATRLQDSSVRSRTEELRDRYRWGLERFIQEARTLARFDHPNIVRVLSVFEFNNTAYMVMRFEEGGTLSAMLDRRGTLPEPDLLRILLPILDGLELVHKAGFIHRDIKPDNIHIEGDGRPVLLDFGSARQSLGSSNTLTILIAPGYAPFEQYYSDPSAQGPWTDIYGLGATCYRAICGRAPLDAVSRSKGILGSTQEVMVPATVVGAGRYSGRVLAAIDHALAFGEKDRPQTIAEWRQELVGESAVAVATPTARAAGSLSRESPTPATTQIRAATAPTIVAEASKPSAEPVSPPRPAILTGARYPWARPLVAAAAIALIAVAVYALVVSRSDETQSKIAALEKQMKDKEAADAERERKAKAQTDDEARRRKAQEEARAEEDNTRRELGRSREPAVQPEPQAKRRDEAAAKQSPKAKSPSQALPPVGAPPAATPSVQPAPSPVTSPGQSPTAGTAPPATPAPEPAKSAPKPPAELVADADRAIAAQRYADAIAVLKPLAEAGNAQAQTRLGDAYAGGHGVARDATVAERWYEKAALQGDTGAQLKLGAIFAKGDGVPQNNNIAYVWYGTAAQLGSSSAKTERDKIAPLLQPAEREQAERVIAGKLKEMGKKP